MDFIKDSIIDKVKEIVEDFTDGQVQFDQDGIKMDGNKYIDALLTKVNSKLKDAGLDHTDLPSQSVDFQKSIACGLSLSGQADLMNGLASGLDTLSRFGDTSVEMLKSPMITARTSLGIKKAVVDYTVRAQVWFLSQDIKLVGSLSDILVSLELKVMKDLSVSMEKYEVTNRGDLELNLEDLESYDHILTDIISSELQSTIKEAVVECLEKSIKNIVADVVSKFGWKKL